MPDPSGLQPPYLDPSQYPDYLDAQRKSMLANMLLNSAQTGNQTPPDWDSMRVVPRRGLMQNIAPIAKMLMAGKTLQSAQQAQAKYFSGLYGGPDSAASAAAPNGQPSIQGTSPGQASMIPPSAQQGNSSMIAPGMSRQQAQAMLSMMGPEKYAEMLAQQYKPAEIQAQLRAAGIDPNSLEGRRIALKALNKQTTNVTDVRPSGTLFDNNTGKPIFTAPGANGVQIGWGPNGPVAGSVPGFQEAEARGTGLETAAKVTNTPQIFPTAGGGSTVAYPPDALGAPPALRSAPQANGPQANMPAASPKGYFPSTQPPPVPKDPNDPWNGMPKLPVSKALGAPDAFTEGRLKAAGAKDAELSSQYGKEADLADQKLQYNAEAVKALPAAETGPMSEWLTENRAKLLELGVPESVIPGSGKVTPTMELNKNLKQSALQGARAIFGSRMTQMEVRLQHEELSPSTSMTKDAIASLMQQDNIKQQYAKQRSEDYGKYVQQGGDPLRFESWYSKSFPLTKYAQQHVQAAPPQKQAPPAALQYLQQHPEAKDAFKQKYGYLP